MSPANTPPSLAIVRDFRSSPEKVWEAWTSGAALGRWMAPSKEFTIPTVEVDLRVGGRYRIVMRSPDGELHDVSGVYRSIEPYRRLEFTWAWKSTPERESLVAIELRPTRDGTQLTLTHAQFADEAARDRHREGWAGCLDQLGNFLAASSPLKPQHIAQGGVRP